jgi:FixJ family two-component response regulator
MKNNLKICIIDDDPDWCDNLKAMIKFNIKNVDVQTFFKKENALEFFKHKTFNLLIIDLRLTPEISRSYEDGFLFAEMANNRNIPIIVLSAFGTKQNVRRAFKNYNIHDFIFKGEFNKEAFLTSIKSAILVNQLPQSDVLEESIKNEFYNKSNKIKQREEKNITRFKSKDIKSLLKRVKLEVDTIEKLYNYIFQNERQKSIINMSVRIYLNEIKEYFPEVVGYLKNIKTMNPDSQLLYNLLILIKVLDIDSNTKLDDIKRNNYQKYSYKIYDALIGLAKIYYKNIKQK